MDTRRDLCFVIMPFSKTATHPRSYWTKHFNDFLKPLIEENPTLEARRSQAMRGDLLTQIITNLATARVVVADLTDNNCNVFWELGVRQSFKHGTVTVAEINTVLPFDAASTGTLFYDPKDHLQVQEFRKEFKVAIDDCLSHPSRPDSHVLETLSGRGTLFELFRLDETMRRLQALETSCSKNKETLDLIISLAQINKEKKVENGQQVARVRVTTRLGTAALELLTTNRYLDTDEDFYAAAAGVLELCLMVNAQLDGWRQDPNTEDWILGKPSEVPQLLDRFIAEVRSIRTALHSRP